MEYRSGDAPYPTVELAAATIANAATGWSSEAFDETPSGDVSAFDLTIDAGTGANHIVVVAADVGVYLADASGATTELTAEFGGAPIPGPAAIAIAAEDGTIRLLYLDDGESAAVIRSSDDAGDTWTVTSPDGFTADAELESLQLEAPDDRIFAGWIADASGEGAAFVRAYQ